MVALTQPKPALGFEGDLRLADRGRLDNSGRLRWEGKRRELYKAVLEARSA